MKKQTYPVESWRKDENASFKGWNFSYLKNRWSEKHNEKWNYVALATQYIKKSGSVLDMATGGGEIFSQILSKHRPEKTTAIEGYKPNVVVAMKNLRKYKASVLYAHETKRLPFKASNFDLVLNRHGGLNQKSIQEIYRVLSPGGILLTQQVDSKNFWDLRKTFSAKPKWKNNTLNNIKKHLKKSGFKIISTGECNGRMIFNDVGAIVYFLKTTPWIVDDFSIENHIHILKKLQKRLEAKGNLKFSTKRFYILALKQ